MKKIKLAAAAVTLLIVFATVSSCKKTSNDTTSYGNWNASVNSAATTGIVQLCSYQKSTKTLALHLQPSLTVQYPNIEISGADASGADVTSGTSYNLNGTSGFTAIYTASAGGQPFTTDLIGSGQLTVTNIDLTAKTMSATFSFNAIEFMVGVHDTAFVTGGSLPSVTIHEF